MRGKCLFRTRPDGCFCAAAGLTEQTGEQRDEGRADQHHTTASHELLDALRLGAGVVVAVAFHEVDNTPHCETGTEGDNERLKNRDSLIDKSRRFSSLNR